MENLILLFIGTALVNNFVLTKFLGICPFIGVSKQLNVAFGMGLAVIFVMIISSIATWLIYNLVLAPLNIIFLKYVIFILVIAALVQFVEIFLKKFNPNLFNAFGIYLAIITTNCTILALVLMNQLNNYSLIESIVYGLGAGVGFTLALIIMAGIRERLEIADIPKPLRGAPIALIIAGILALAFMGFTGMM